MSDIHPGKMAKDKPVEPRLIGIRGWLIVPAIGLVVSTLVPLLLASVGIVCVLLGVVNVRRFLSSFLRETMNPDYGVYVLSATVAAGILYLYGCVTCWRFLKKTQSAPRTYIRLLVFSFVASLYLFVLGLAVFGVDDVLVLTNLLVVHNPLGFGVAAAIWIPYFKVSARVRATFVKEDNPCLPYKIVLPMRYLLKRRITHFAVLAVALCVFIVVVVMTVMTGLVSDFKQKNHDFVGDCVVGTESLVGFAYYEDFVNILEKQDFVEGVSPVIKSYALISLRGSQRNRGLEIMGIEPVRHSRVTGFGKTLHYRKDDVSRTFEPSYGPNLLGCVLGIDLAFERDLNGNYYYYSTTPQNGYSISCFPLTSRGALSKAGAGLVDTKIFYYSDTSQSGLARVDSSLFYLPFEWAQRLCGMDGPTKRASAIHIKFKPDVRLQAGCEKVGSLWQKFKQRKAGERQAYLLDAVTVQNWKDYRRSSIAPMEKEQTVMAVMFAFVGITTVFIVFVVFYMIISHKSKDIGILKSIGVSNAAIMELFSGFAFLVGLLGSCIGLFGGWLFLLKINRIENWLFERFNFQLWDRTIYAIGDIPNQVNAKVLGVIVLSAIVACLAGALVPSRQAAKQNPVEILQVNQL